MVLQSSVQKGDWIRAKHLNGGEIVGQAEHDLSMVGYAALRIVIEDKLVVEINVNLWDVVVIKRNMLPSQK